MTTETQEYIALQSLQATYEKIVQGTAPWLAIGEFLHQFFGYRSQCRAELLANPIELPENATPEQQQWAAFCAGTAEYLANHYNLACPEWANDPQYVLPEAWFPGLEGENIVRQERLKQRSHEELAKRNVFCSKRVYWNKYEVISRIDEKISA